jgi:hypothetical protein
MTGNVANNVGSASVEDAGACDAADAASRKRPLRRHPP